MPKKQYDQYFLPEHRITASATLVNGLTTEKLQSLGAHHWTKGKSDILAAFLNERKDLPIVAHSAKYDRDEVLGPAYDRVGNIKNLPDSSRWRCTFELSYRLPKSNARNLDEVLEALGMNPRKDDEPHNAIHDAMLCGEVYKKLIKLQNPSKP